MADRYFVNGGVDNNWGSTSNWSTTSGGAGGASVPTSADAAFLDGNSPNCTVNASNRACLSLNCTGYTNTLTMTFNITASGSVTLASGMTIAGSGSLTIAATATLTSNGKTWPNDMLFSGTSTFTLADNWTVSGSVTMPVANNAQTFNGNNLYVAGSLSFGFANQTISGTTHLHLTGSGSIGGMSTGIFRLPWTINASGTYTVASGTAWVYGTGTFTFTAGTVTFSGTHTLTISGVGTQLDLDGLTLKTVVFSQASASTTTLLSNMQVSGLCSIGVTNQTLTLNGFAVECQAGLRFAQTTGVVQGTTELVMTATGTLDAPSITGGSCSNPIVIDAPTGDITISDTTLNTRPGKFVVRDAQSITTTEAWNLGGGAASLNPLTSIYGKV